MSELLSGFGSAVISADGVYRYRLERDTGLPGKTAAVIMVNGSTADGKTNDHTIRKLFGFSYRLGIGRFIVGNKFGFRARDIKKLRTAADPVGPENDHHLEQIMRDAELHIVAWGPLGKLPPHLRTRWREVVAISARVGCPLFCLGVAKDGQPRHPLMLGYNAVLTPWQVP